MFVEIKRITIKEGFAERIIEKFSGQSKMQEFDGFLEISVMKGLKKSEVEEILIESRWRDQEAYTKWKQSDFHKAGHANKKEKPEFMVDISVSMYNVEVTKTIAQ